MSCSGPFAKISKRAEQHSLSLNLIELHLFSVSLLCQGLRFRETPGDYDFDFHTAPARQFIVSLDAAVDIEVSDGTRKVFQPGTVMLVEDTWGKV